MINIFKLLKKSYSNKKSRQQVLLDFVNDSENIKKAAEGSMDKRIELIDRVLNNQTA